MSLDPKHQREILEELRAAYPATVDYQSRAGDLQPNLFYLHGRGYIKAGISDAVGEPNWIQWASITEEGIEFLEESENRWKTVLTGVLSNGVSAQRPHLSTLALVGLSLLCTGLLSLQLRTTAELRRMRVVISQVESAQVTVESQMTVALKGEELESQLGELETRVGSVETRVRLLEGAAVEQIPGALCRSAVESGKQM